MRFTDLLLEREANVPGMIAAKQRSKVRMSLADIYDMTGQPYPLIRDKDTGVKIVPPEFFDQRDFGIGIPNEKGEIEAGSLDPKFVQAYDQWVAGGKTPGLLYDESTGDLRPYNENSYLEDFAWEVAAGTAELAANLTRGAATGIDGALNLTFGRLGLYDGYKVTRAAEDTWMDDFQEKLSNKTDLDFRDTRDIMANAVTEPGDLLGLFYGEAAKDLSWAGFGAMYATELPSSMLDAALVTAGPLGRALNVAINAAEASGAAVKQIRDTVKANYESGQLQTTNQWKSAMIMAEEQLRLDGELGGDPKVLEGKLHDLAIDVITDNTYNSTLLAVAGSGAVLDTISDRMVFGRIKPTALRRAVARIAISPQVEGIDEAFQETWIQRGLINDAGDANPLWQNTTNAYYQGVLIGKAEAGVGTVLDTLGSTKDVANKGRKAGIAKLRRFFYGTDAGNLETIIDVAGLSPELLLNNVLTPEGRLALKKAVEDKSITDVSQLSRGDQRKLSRTGRVTVNGQELTQDKITQNKRNAELMGFIDEMHYDSKENKWAVTFGDEDDIRDAASLLGIEAGGKRKINAVMKELEEVTKLDFRVEGVSDLEAPTWSQLNPIQKAEFVNKGYVDFSDAEGVRAGQRWTRDDVERSSRRYNDWNNVPPAVKNLVDPTDARPEMDAADQREINALQAQIDNNLRMKKSMNDLQSDQELWDQEYGDDPENAPEPRPTRDMPGDPYNFTGATAATSFIQREIDNIKTNLKNSQQDWDNSYGKTHNRNGTPRLDKKLLTGDQNDARNQRYDSGFRKTDDKEVEPNPSNVAPNVVEPGSVDQRANIVNNNKARLANNATDPIAIRTQIETLEKTYPGIADEILGPGGIDNYIENSETVQKKTAEELKTAPPPVTPTAKPKRAREGTEIERDGQTYRWLGVENGVGGMWAPVKPDGSLGSTGSVNSQLQKSLSDEAIERLAPTKLGDPDVDSQLDDAPVYTDPKPIDPQTSVDVTKFQKGDTVTYTNKKGETRDAKVVAPLDNGNLSVTLNGANYAITPDIIDSTPVTQDQVKPKDNEPEPQAFLIPPATDADQQYANVDVPQNIKDEFADVVATRNGIKIQQWLNSQPNQIAGALRLQGPAFDPPEVGTQTAPTRQQPNQTDTSPANVPGKITKPKPRPKPNTLDVPGDDSSTFVKPKQRPSRIATPQTTVTQPDSSQSDSDKAPNQPGKITKPNVNKTPSKIQTPTVPNTAEPEFDRSTPKPPPEKGPSVTTTAPAQPSSDTSTQKSNVPKKTTLDPKIKRDNQPGLVAPDIQTTTPKIQTTTPDLSKNDTTSQQTDGPQTKTSLDPNIKRDTDQLVTPDDFTSAQTTQIDTTPTVALTTPKDLTKKTDQQVTIKTDPNKKKTKTDTKKKPSLLRGLRGAFGGDKKQKKPTGNMMQFSPINIRDPLNYSQIKRTF